MDDNSSVRGIMKRSVIWNFTVRNEAQSETSDLMLNLCIFKVRLHGF